MTQREFSDLLVEDTGDGVHLVTLNRPDALNALTWDGIAELADALDSLACDPSCRAAVLTGAGRAFSAGGDVKAQADRVLRPGSEDLFVSQAGQSVRRVWDFPKPLVAAVNGLAIGAGAGLALLCDVRIIDAQASMSFPFARVGLSPDLGVAWTLPRNVGRGHASRLIMTGERVDAEECARIGLAEVTSEPGESVSEAMKIALQAAAMSPSALSTSKSVSRTTSSLGFSEALAVELDAQLHCRLSDDHREGVSAFLERRTPQFKGE